VWRFASALAARARRASRTAQLGFFGLASAGIAAAAAGRAPAVETALVKREDLPLGVEVEGELVAVQSTDIGPPVVREMWEFKIAFLAPESAPVKKGQPIIGFDPSNLQRQLEEKQAEYAEASKRIERKELELQNQRRDLELQLAETESRLEKARLKADVPEELRARNEVQQTALELKNAEQALGNLKARIAGLHESQEASLRSLLSQRDRAKLRVAELQAAIEAMTIRAPQDGIVIYRTGWRDEKKKVGDSVWFGEKLLSLPDLKEMRADGDVDESDAGAVAVGQRVTLRLEALPDKDQTGKVARIGRAVRRKSFRVPNKVFKVQIALDRTDPALRPAMRFRGDVETGRIARALTIPRDAVFLRVDGPVVWLKGWRGFREVKVGLGRHNRRLVEVTSGLAEGDQVALTDLTAEPRS
jgi:multidrug efflux pump subunit AcrA (membrane-fusion protein)